MSKQLRAIVSGALALCLVLMGIQTRAGVTASLSFQTPSNFAGITSWPSTPTISTTGALSPAAFIVVTDHFGRDAFNLGSIAQSFTATMSGKLTQIQLPITGTAPHSFTLKIFDGGNDHWQTYPDANNYSFEYRTPDKDQPNVSANLLTDTSELRWEQFTVQGTTAAVMNFALTGVDQINVVSGNRYIVEFQLTANTENDANNFFIGRNAASNNYNQGIGFRNGTAFNGVDRDIAMAFTITPPSTLAADFNSVDGVNAADLAIWKSGYGTGTTKAQGDADGDLDVDGNDFLTWQRQLGLTSALPAVSAVPEPGTGSLLVASLVLAAHCAVARARTHSAI